MNTKNIGIYVHIPFCKKKCKYCDFKSYEGKEKLIEEYIKWVNYELEQVGDGNKQDYEKGLDKLAVIDTIYIGGGTPSYINSNYIVEIMNTIKEHYTIEDNAEITIEVNPGTINEDKLKDYIDCGINRISIGLQSTNEKILKQIGRIHGYKEFGETFELAREIGFKNINVDLMLGLPNQKIEDLEDSLEKIVSYNPEHISVYSLIVEENTVLCREIQEGILNLPPEKIERDMYWKVKQRLEQSGYKHYEISNFARPNFESNHNMNCWKQEEYIGIGAGAHSYTNNIRYSNVDTIEEYIKNFREGQEIDNLIFHEKQNKESKMKEYMLLGLRKIDGIKIQKFKNKFGENPIYLYRKELEKLVKENLIEINGDDIKLTEKGLNFANLVWEEFV